MNTYTDEELDMLVEIDENLNAPATRGRAYKRIQRRNHIEKRKKQSKDWYFLPPFDFDSRSTGSFAKQHLGCQKARCKICKYSKVYKLPTIKEIRYNEKMKYDMKEIYE